MLVKHLRDDGWIIAERGPLEIHVTLPGEAASGVFNLHTLYQHYLNGALIGDMADAQSVRYMKASEIEMLNQPFDDLLETALSNLYARSEGAVYELGDQESGKLFVLATQDGYDATRILLSPLPERLAQLVSGELIIGIPNRDFFIAFGNSNPLIVGQLGQQIRKDAQTRTHPLTATLFTFRNGQLQVYEANA